MQVSPDKQGMRQYGVITANYWAFTITDGALRMMVLLYFYSLGYSGLELAFLFLFYEIFGVVTNLVGGWLGARFGLNRTMNLGLSFQILALAMLLLPQESLSIPWVMAAQALSGIAKDLNKMSAKSAIKNLVPKEQLFTWVARLTGSKNTLKGLGFFLGALLLSTLGFQFAVGALILLLLPVLLMSLLCLGAGLGKSKSKAKFREIFANSRSLNQLSAARLFLFAARDVWFVVALPVSLAAMFSWSHAWVGGFMACWIILYGFVQSAAPGFIRQEAGGKALFFWAMLLAVLILCVALCLAWASEGQLLVQQGVLLFGLLAFAVIFAINSAYHSYLVVAFARSDGVSLDVGFYYMSNALGRLLGTVLSGLVFQYSGLAACLLLSAVFLATAATLAKTLPAAQHPSAG